MTKSNLLIWPVEEVEQLRTSHTSHSNIALKPAETWKVKGGDGNQVYNRHFEPCSTYKNIVSREFNSGDTVSLCSGRTPLHVSEFYVGACGAFHVLEEQQSDVSLRRMHP